MTLETTTFAVVGIVFFAALVRTTFGFGDALVAMPLLSFVVPVRLATPLVALLSVIVAVAILYRDWRQLHWRSAAWMIFFGLIGVPIGVFFVKEIDERVVKGVLSGVVIGFSLFKLAGPRLPTVRSDRWAGAAGFFAGLLGGAYNTHAPAIVIYGAMREWPPARFRATLQVYFLAVWPLLLFSHAVSGLWTAEVFELLLWCVPGVLAAIVLGDLSRRHISRRAYSKYIYGLLLVLGFMLLLDAVDARRIVTG